MEAPVTHATFSSYILDPSLKNFLAFISLEPFALVLEESNYSCALCTLHYTLRTIYNALHTKFTPFAPFPAWSSFIKWLIILLPIFLDFYNLTSEFDIFAIFCHFLYFLWFTVKCQLNFPPDFVGIFYL